MKKNGDRFGTFPDLIMTLDAKTAKPIVSAAIEKGQNITVISVPKEKLILSTTMSNEKLMRPIEGIIHTELFRYLLDEAKDG
ncbi:hypothetical protein AB9M62_02740 [Bacillales bacterium AN1005]